MRIRIKNQAPAPIMVRSVTGERVVIRVSESVELEPCAATQTEIAALVEIGAAQVTPVAEVVKVAPAPKVPPKAKGGK